MGSADLSERRQFHDDVSARILRHDPKELDNVRMAELVHHRCRGGREWRGGGGREWRGGEEEVRSGEREEC